MSKMLEGTHRWTERSVLEVRGMCSTGFVSSGGVAAEPIRPSISWPSSRGASCWSSHPVPGLLGPELESSFCVAFMDAPVPFTSPDRVGRGFANCLLSLESSSGSASWKRGFEKIDLAAEVKGIDPLLWFSGSRDAILSPRILPQRGTKEEEAFNMMGLGSYYCNSRLQSSILGGKEKNPLSSWGFFIQNVWPTTWIISPVHKPQLPTSIFF